MIARSLLPTRWLEWNGWTGAPYHGPFAHFRVNSPTRVWEYPWAAEALGDVTGRRILDVGGGMGGLAFVLGRVAEEVVVVDPDEHPRSGPAMHDAWARTWNARVRRVHGTAGDVGGVFDAAVCLSVIEHIADAADRCALMRAVYERLRPGGMFVLSLDLDLGLWPFTDRPYREELNLRNLSVAELLGAAPFVVVAAAEQELLGLPGFDTVSILGRASRGEFLVGNGHVCAQCILLARPVE